MSAKILTLNGNVLVNNGNAITADVGGGSLQESKTVNPTTSQQTVTPDSGYDGLEQVIVTAIPEGTAGTPQGIKGTVSNNSVSISPVVTNETGYITGGIKYGTDVTVSASELVSGSQTITANANNIDVTNLASVDVLVKPILKMGVIRPDAEIVKTWGYDVSLVNDWELTVPAYSTSAQTIKASEAATGTYTLDYTNYDYFMLQRMLSIPTYSITSKGKGRVEYWLGIYGYEVVTVPASTYHALIDDTAYTSRNTVMAATGYTYRSIYWNTTTTISPYATGVYSTVQTVVAPTISSGVVTVNTPTVTIRGSTTYFTSTYFNAITDIRYQWIAELYRAPKANLNLDGWGMEQQLKHIVDCVESTTHKLTQKGGSDV